MIDNIDKHLRRAKAVPYGGGHIAPGLRGTYYRIGHAKAKQILREVFPEATKPPRPGYFIALPLMTHVYKSGNKVTGHWELSNSAGRYELQFMENDPFNYSRDMDTIRERTGRK